MLFRKTERYYKEYKKTFLKHGKFDKDTHGEVVKRTTIWFLFIPLFYWEKVVGYNLS
jgi:hypothetical protein